MTTIYNLRAATNATFRLTRDLSRPQHEQRGAVT
jgi:hypothetical protein